MVDQMVETHLAESLHRCHRRQEPRWAARHLRVHSGVGRRRGGRRNRA